MAVLVNRGSFHDRGSGEVLSTRGLTRITKLPKKPAPERPCGDLRAPAGHGRAKPLAFSIIDAAEAVLAANRRFYEAFEARNIDEMSDLWERSDRSSCTHPGWAMLRGWGPIAASFFALFQGSRQMQFVLTEQRVQVVGDVAWVCVDENLLGDQSGATIAAVNIFVRTDSTGGARGSADDGGWRMVCHHGSVVNHSIVQERRRGS